MMSSSSSSSSDSEEDIKAIVAAFFEEYQTSTNKNENYFEETVQLYTEKEFMDHFRVSRGLFLQISQMFRESTLYPKEDKGYERISAEKSMAAFLYFAVNEGKSYKDVSDKFNISKGATHNLIHNIMMFLSNLSSTAIKWPTEEEKLQIAQEFREMGFENCIGVIDGTHIRIKCPKDDPESYYNRKKYFSIQVQIVCDSNRRIRDVFIGYPGSVHDARVFRTSTIGRELEVRCGAYHLLGDSAYPCLVNLITPYKKRGELNDTQKYFNKKLSHVRVIIEHTNGLLKGKFRKLLSLNFNSVETSCHFIRACCVLHNLTLEDAIDTEETPVDNNDHNNNVDNDDDDENEGSAPGLQKRNYLAALMYSQK